MALEVVQCGGHGSPDPARSMSVSVNETSWQVLQTYELVESAVKVTIAEQPSSMPRLMVDVFPRSVLKLQVLWAKNMKPAKSVCMVS